MSGQGFAYFCWHRGAGEYDYLECDCTDTQWLTSLECRRRCWPQWWEMQRNRRRTNAPTADSGTTVAGELP